MAGEDTHQLAARIAQRLREAGLNSQILNLVPADTAVLRRDRVVVILALTLLTALAWSTCCGYRLTWAWVAWT
jgi:hypothetical protein